MLPVTWPVALLAFRWVLVSRGHGDAERGAQTTKGSQCGGQEPEIRVAARLFLPKT